MEPATSPADADRVDQRVTLHGVTWEQYEAFLEMRGESSALRVTYLEGELEIMAPSIDHEDLKTKLARLVEAWADETDVVLEGAGSWTVKRRAAERGAEPDECYVLGRPLSEAVERPDVAIEVVWTSGGIRKLDVWRGLRVPEVWIWEDGSLAFYELRDDEYVRVPRSARLPALDPALLEACMAAPTQTDAVKQLRARLRGSTPT